MNHKIVKSTPSYSTRIWNYVKENYTFLSRVALIVTAIIATVAYGTGAYFILRDEEIHSSETQYYSLSKAAIDSITVKNDGRIHAVHSMSSIYRSFYPDYNTWPNVTVPNYEDIAKKIRLSASKLSFGSIFSPMVNSSDQSSFEAFAANYIGGLYPDGNVGTVSGEIAIWTYDQNRNRIRDNFGDYDFLFPVFQLETIDTSFTEANTMANIYRDPDSRAAFNSVLDCVSNNLDKTNEEQAEACSASYILSSQSLNEDNYGIIAPVTVNDNGVSKVVGICGNLERFEAIFENLFPEFVRGIDIVVEGSDDSQFTYSIEGKNAKFVGAKDAHDRGYDQYRKRLHLSNEDSLDISPVYYTVSIYPTQEFFDYYETDTPWVATALAVSIIILASIIFFIYDYFMRSESKWKSSVMEAKRNFVRYISHEIRTPLNTVYLGLTILEQGFTKRLGELRSGHNQKQFPIANGSNKVNKSSSAELINSMHGDVNIPASFYQLDSVVNTTSEDTLNDWLEMCQDLLVNVRNAVDVLTDILNYDKVQTQTLTLEISEIPVWSTIASTVKTFELQAQQKNIALNMTLNNNTEDVDLLLMADKGHIVQVIRNLVSNALKFTPENGIVTVAGEWVEDDLNNVEIGKEDKKRIIQHARKVEKVHKKKLVTRSSTVAGGGDAAMDCCLWASKPIGSMLSKSNSVDEDSIKDIRIVGMLCLTVTDNGAGLSEEQLKQMFQEGVQFNRNRLQAGGGSGLGLAISKGIVNQHGGTLEVSSEGLGFGSTFTLLLPVFLPKSKKFASPTTISKQDGTQITARPSTFKQRMLADKVPEVIMEEGYSKVNNASRDQSSEMINSKQTQNDEDIKIETKPDIIYTQQDTDIKSLEDLRILVVDDTALNRKMLARLLKSKGHNDITQAIDGLDAIEKYKEARDNGCPFDLVLMDYEMPNMNGPTAAMNIRLLGAMMPIIGVTGNVLPADKRLFMEHGANDVVGKPFEYTLLTDILQQLHNIIWKPLEGTELEKKILENNQ